MTRSIFALLALIVIALTQVTILPAVLPTTFRPDVVLAAAITWGALASYRQAVPMAVLGGFFVDIWTDGPVGLTALLAGLLAFSTAIGETPLVPATVAFPLILTFGAEIVLQVLRLLIFQAIGRQVEFTEPGPAILLLTAATSALIVLPAYPIAKMLYRRFGRPVAEW